MQQRCGHLCVQSYAKVDEQYFFSCDFFTDLYVGFSTGWSHGPCIGMLFPNMLGFF